MGKVFRIIGIILIVGVMGFGIFYANKSTPNSEKVWDERQTVGNMDAKNFFVVYSDIMCPYCVAFENAIFENEEEFEKYIEENDVLLEVRIADFLYNYSEAQPVGSLYSSEALFCARNEGKFWEYYKNAITTVWNDYFKDSGKNAFSAMSSLGKDYWINLGIEVGLGDSFSDCVKNDEVAKEVDETAERIAEVAAGMPYFVFNNYTTSGFDPSWGWEYVLNYFNSGLSSKH